MFMQSNTALPMRDMSIFQLSIFRPETIANRLCGPVTASQLSINPLRRCFLRLKPTPQFCPKFL